MPNPKKQSPDHHHHRGTGRGPSSYWMHDSKTVFGALALKPGEIFLDLGCGPGDYSLAAARIVGPAGTVTGMDQWQYHLDGLTAAAACQGLNNLTAVAGDITDILPVEDRSIDCCLLSTALHIFTLAVAEKTTFREIRRILAPFGRLAVIECKKEEQPFGPPVKLRISPQELEATLIPLGYRKIDYLDLG